MQSVPKKSKFGILQIAKYFIFVVFAAWAFHYISNLTSQEELGKSLRQIPWWAYLAALIGTTINWTLESAKWHKLINTIQFSSFSTSAKAVLSGTAVGNLLPYKIGEYLGKLYYVNNDKRALSIPLSFISSTIQLFVNLSLCKLIVFLDLDGLRHKLHLFRMGAAKTAFLKGHSEDNI